MAAEITGRCLCGAVSYAARAEPLMMMNCHCRDCQRASGSAYAAVVVVPIDSVQVEGELRFHKSVGDEGNVVERGFCPICGGRVANKLGRIPNILALMAGSMDDPSMYQPTMEIFTASAHPWDHMAAHTEKFAQGPTGRT